MVGASAWECLVSGEDVAGEAIWFSPLLLLPQESPVGHQQYRGSLRESRKQEAVEGTDHQRWRREKQNKKPKGNRGAPLFLCIQRFGTDAS